MSEDVNESRIISAAGNREEDVVDRAIRPRLLADYIGRRRTMIFAHDDFHAVVEVEFVGDGLCGKNGVCQRGKQRRKK